MIDPIIWPMLGTLAVVLILVGFQRLQVWATEKRDRDREQPVASPAE